MAHIIEPTHSDRFIAILGEHYPTWREARAELNDLPLAAETWKEWLLLGGLRLGSLMLRL